MRFLHTSDWHVGRTIRARSRLEEHRAVLQEIVDIAQEEQVDAVLITGDIFHDRRPPLTAEELVAETLAKLARAQIPSVLIPGNHDDPARLRTLKPLGDLIQAHIMSDPSEDLVSLVVPLAAHNGQEKALVGCLPYLHPHQVLTAAEGAGTTEEARMSAYQSKVQDYFRALEATMEQMDRRAITLILAHAHIWGSEMGGGEWRSSVFPIQAGFLPAHAYYVALGHLHKPQRIQGSKSQAYYAGSILQMEFGWQEQEKSVWLIEAHPSKPAEVRPIKLGQGRRLLRLPSGSVQEVLAQAEELKDAWIEAILRPEGGVLPGRDPELMDRLRALETVVSIRFEEPTAKPASTAPSLKSRPPKEIFSEYYKTKRKADPDPQLVNLFERLYQEVITSPDEVP